MFLYDSLFKIAMFLKKSETFLNIKSKQMLWIQPTFYELGLAKELKLLLEVYEKNESQYGSFEWNDSVLVEALSNGLLKKENYFVCLKSSHIIIILLITLIINSLISYSTNQDCKKNWEFNQILSVK